MWEAMEIQRTEGRTQTDRDAAATLQAACAKRDVTADMAHTLFEMYKQQSLVHAGSTREVVRHNQAQRTKEEADSAWETRWSAEKERTMYGGEAIPDEEGDEETVCAQKDGGDARQP